MCVKRRAQINMVGKTLDHCNDVRVFEKNEATVAVVIRQSPEGFGP